MTKELSVFLYKHFHQRQRTNDVGYPLETSPFEMRQRQNEHQQIIKLHAGVLSEVDPEGAALSRLKNFATPKYWKMLLALPLRENDCRKLPWWNKAAADPIRFNGILGEIDQKIRLHFRPLGNNTDQGNFRKMSPPLQLLPALDVSGITVISRGRS